MRLTTRSNKVEAAPSEQSGAGAIAVEEYVRVGASGVLVQGNVEGSIYVENKHMAVHADHGAIVNYYDAPPRVKKRDVAPQPTRPLRGFVNRTRELDQLERIITGGEMATVYGLDGMGKTALLKQAANGRAAGALPDGVLFLEGIDEAGRALGTEDVIQRLFDKSYESEPRLKVNFDVAQTYLSNLRPLVVLNGLDLPVTALVRIPDLYPRGAVLIESNFWIDDDRSASIRLESLPRAEAIQLLAAKAGSPPDDETLPVFDSICALLSDVPLAIVLVARVIRESDLSLEYARDFLASTGPGSAEAGRSGIERAYALALATLSDLERQWLAAAALAPGVSIDPAYLHQLAGDEAAAERTQERLQALGLLTANSPRLRIHPALRDLARPKEGEVSLYQRFLDFLKSNLRARSLDWEFCADELGNITGMISWAAQNRRWEDAIALGRAIDPYLALHGLWETWQETVQSVLRSARRLGDRANEAWALHQLGTRAIGAGWTDQAADFLRQALDLRRALGDVVGMAYTQHNLDLLIPPASSGGDGGEPPDGPSAKPVSPRKPFQFLVKAFLIGATLALSGYLAVNALYSPAVVEPPKAPVAAVTPRPATKTATTVKTRTPLPTKTSTKLPTPTRTLQPTRPPTATPDQGMTGALACTPKLTGLQDANCRVGPSTLFEVYGTLFEGQTVGILASNESGSWFMVDHPQSFRNPCWVWNGPAVEERGDLSCLAMVSVPLPSDQNPAPKPKKEPPPAAPPPGGIIYQPPLLEIFPYLVCVAPSSCPSGSKWNPNNCRCEYPPAIE